MATTKKTTKAESTFSFEKLTGNMKQAVLANLGLYGKIFGQAKTNYELAQSQLELSQAQIQNAFSVSPAAQFNEFAERGEQLQNEVKGKFEDLSGAVDLEANLAKVRAAVESVKSRLTPKAAA